MKILYSKTKDKITYSLVKTQSKKKHPFVVVAEDENKVCGMEIARFETKELAIKAVERIK